jgi:4-hydroxybenzoate polyprenyltransferase
MRSLIAEYLRLMRLPGAATVAIPLLFGALSVNVSSLAILVPLFIIGVLSGIYGLLFNDYIDAELDTLSPDLSKRALVKGTISKNAAKSIIIGCFCVSYILVFVFFYRNHVLFFSGLACLIGADVLGGIHNVFGKRLIGSDFLLACAHSLYLLFGALIVIQDGKPGVLTWVFFVLVFCQLVYDNAVLGGIKDADHDILYKVKNIALSSGVRVHSDKTMVVPFRFQVFGVGVRFLSCVIVFIPFMLNILPYDAWQILVLFVLVILLVLTSIRMVTLKLFDRVYVRKLILLQEFLWYPAISLLLMPLIGFFPTLLLILLPGGWYVLFSVAIGGKILEPVLI